MNNYEEVKQNAGLFDFSLEGKIIVRGVGSVDFLNGIVSNDVKKLSVNEGCYAAFLNKLGKVLSDCVIYKFEDHFLLNMNIMGKKNILPLLKEEAPLGKSEIEDVSMKYGLFSVMGSKSKEVLEKLFGEKIGLEQTFQVTMKKISINNENNKNSKNEDNEKINNGGNKTPNKENNEENNQIIITKNNRTNIEGFDLFVPAKHYSDFKKLILGYIKEMGNGTFELLRLEAKKPLYGIDFDGNNILPEVTERATSYDKGCFVGQEIVVRVKNLAKGLTAKKLFAFEINGNNIPEKNEKIMYEGSEAGFITSAAKKDNTIVALGYLKKDFFEKKDFRIKDQETTASPVQ